MRNTSGRSDMKQVPACGCHHPPFAAICGFTCETAQAFTDAFLPVASQLQGDIPNYTDIEPIIQISEVHEIPRWLSR